MSGARLWEGPSDLASDTRIAITDSTVRQFDPKAYKIDDHNKCLVEKDSLSIRGLNQPHGGQKM